MIEHQREGEVVMLTMRHGKVNAMDLEFCRELNHAVDLARRSDCRSVIVTGFDKIFSAGVDLVRLIQEPREYLDQFLPELVSMFRNVFEFPKPLVAAINGHAVAGGCVVACACDHRIITTTARIGVPELRVGVPFPSEGLEIMRYVAAEPNFRRMISSGATYKGPDAVDAGLADETAPAAELLSRARQVAEELMLIQPDVYRLNKEQTRLPALERIASGNKEFGARINRLWRSDETRKTIEHYVQTRLKTSSK